MSYVSMIAGSKHKSAQLHVMICWHIYWPLLFMELPGKDKSGYWQRRVANLVYV